jgi:hypothetical protein
MHVAKAEAKNTGVDDAYIDLLSSLLVTLDIDHFVVS